MARRITQRDLRDRSGELQPAPTHRRQFVAAAAAVARFARAPSIDPGLFRTDVDAVLDQDSRPRG